MPKSMEIIGDDKEGGVEEEGGTAETKM